MTNFTIDIHDIFSSEVHKEQGELFREESVKVYIYSLFDINKNLLYVGQTQNISSRFKAHQKNFPEVFSCKFFMVYPEEANNFEFELICRFLPRLNNSLPRCDKYILLEEYQSKNQRFYTNKVKVLRLIEEFKTPTLRGYYLTSDLDDISNLLERIYND